MIDINAPSQLSSHRVIRVFVSSTFRDMQAEREELIKRIFPQLRKICETRGVTWGEVDLRWGVSDEQKAEGEVLPICLDEVRRCRPYFIGLLGERYGWILDGVEPAILAREPWLAGYRGRSVTEIEMVCGVLDNPEMADHAFFYFRDPSASAALRLDPPLEPSPPEASAKLDALKDRIRKSKFPVRERFRSAPELGECILADFTCLIDRLFPPDQAPDPLDREAAMHDAFAANRAGVYVGREDYYACLDAQARGDGAALVVLGASGLGKSALLANWAMRYRAAHPDEFVFVHFLGASPASADWTALLPRFLRELNRRFRMTVPIPDQPEALRKSFADGLRMAGAMHRVVLVLDGLNQLEDRDQAPELAWLPRDLPPRIRLIASTLPGRTLDEIENRGWRTLELAPLRAEERERLIADYLAQYTKTLARAQIALVAGAEMAGNPLFLTALLEELRVWGAHETLEAQIHHYLSATSIGDLFQRILARYENDYDRDRPGLVRDALSAIWAARHGLSEAELLDLLGGDGAPLPRAHWSPLYLAAERSLVSHSGLLGFFHDYLRQAVRDRYLPTEAQQRELHLRLADYFAPRDLSPRKIVELPWQLAQAQAWERLAGVLADLPFVSAAWKQNNYDVRSYWSAVDERIPDAPLTAYQPVFDDPNRYVEYFYLVSHLLLRLNYPQQSGRLQSYLFQTFDQLNYFDADAIISLSIETAANEHAQGKTDAAISLIRRAVDMGRRRGNRSSLAGAIANEATYLAEQGKVTEAEPLFDEAESLARDLDDKKLLGELIVNRVNFIIGKDPARALVVLAELERLVRALGDKDTLIGCLGNQGDALMRLGNLDAALKKFQEQEQLSREIGSMNGVQRALARQGLVLASRNDGDGALKLLAQEEAICRRIGNKKRLAESLLLQATLNSKYRHDLAAATKFAGEHEQICRELGAQPELATGFQVQADLLAQQGDQPGALAALQKAELILRELGDKSELGACLATKAERFEAQGRPIEAIQSLKEAEGLYRELGNFEGLARSLFDQARVYSRMIRMPAAALPGMRRAQELAQTHGLSSLSQQIKQVIDTIRAGTG
jgi:tetratricopeptide (TPR) repeat protein